MLPLDKPVVEVVGNKQHISFQSWAPLLVLILRGMVCFCLMKT